MQLNENGESSWRRVQIHWREGGALWLSPPFIALVALLVAAAAAIALCRTCTSLKSLYTLWSPLHNILEAWH